MKLNLIEARFLKYRFLQYRADDDTDAGNGGAANSEAQAAAEKKIDDILSQVNNDDEPEPVIYNPAEKNFKSIEELETESAAADTAFLDSLTEAEKKEYEKYDSEEKQLFKSTKTAEAKETAREAKKKDAYEKLTAEEKIIWDKKNKAPEAKPKAGSPPKKEGAAAAEDESGELKFTVKDEEGAEPAEEQSTWIGVGKELGLDIKEDSFEEFKTALEKKIKEELPVANADEALQKKVEALEPEAQKLFIFLQNKGKLQDYVAPVKQYDDLLALSNEELVRKNLKINKWEDDKIDEQIAVLKEEGRLDTSGYAIRKSLEAAKVDFQHKLFQNQEQLAKAEQVKTQQLRVKEDKAIRDTLDKVEEYKGGKLPKEEREKIYKKWENGYYRRLMADDPKAVVDMILAYELTDQVIGSAAKRSKTEQVNTHQEKLHNTKRLNSQENSSRTPKNIEVQEGTNFAGWKVELEKM